MNIRTTATAVAFLAFGLVIVVRAQAPGQTPPQAPSPYATPLPEDNDFYALRASAAAGDAQAQFVLGGRYFDGRGVAQDYGQALTWYRYSADQGYAPALNQLGYMHQHKFGLPRDYRRALNYYRLAANKGYAQAEYNLGAMYQSGLGVKR